MLDEIVRNYHLRGWIITTQIREQIYTNNFGYCTEMILLNIHRIEIHAYPLGSLLASYHLIRYLELAIECINRQNAHLRHNISPPPRPSRPQSVYGMNEFFFIDVTLRGSCTDWYEAPKGAVAKL